MGKKHSISLRDLCQLFERLNNGVFFWDRNLRLIACNRIACAFMASIRDS